MFKFITSKPLWVNILVILGLTALLLFAFLQLLGVITKHGSYLTVPAVTSKTTAEAVKLLESKGFEVVIQDSVYTDTAKMGTVLKQFPEPNSTVKVNRVVLLTVNRVTLPLIDMPSLQGKSLSYALDILKRSHLVLGDTTFKPDFMMGSVLEQKFKGTTIASGAKVPWGSTIDLVIGGGLSNEQIMVPELVGLTYEQAKAVLEESGLMLASTVYTSSISDTANAFVVRQMPTRFTVDQRPVYIRSGQIVDLWISKDNVPLVDSTSNKTTTPNN
ncbi:PASTA domain-containing protein [Ferruginibacter yonginensis]|uniref:PASTA domain-containing protein n=1 Tax=Ferruginibacter yonginensis TaxID=1310416 RepID=A0ABV8QSK2_9BACT